VYILLLNTKNSPEASFTQHITMVSAKDDNRVVVYPAILEYLKKLPNAIVNIADRPIVGSSCFLDLFICEILIPQVTDFEETLAVRVLVLLGDPYFGQVYVHAFVQIPVLLLDGVRVMRVCEGNLKRSNPVSSVV
jgi:hypothetical protein